MFRFSKQVGGEQYSSGPSLWLVEPYRAAQLCIFTFFFVPLQNTRLTLFFYHQPAVLCGI